MAFDLLDFRFHDFACMSISDVTPEYRLQRGYIVLDQRPDSDC